MHPHDRRWVDEQLTHLPPELRAGTLDKYQRVYAQTLEQNGVTEARRQANTRLRHYIARIRKNDNY